MKNKSIGELLNRNVVRDKIECMPVIHVNEPLRTKEIADAWYVDGFKTFQVTLRGNAEKGIEVIKDILSVSDDTRVYIVDANDGYTDEVQLITAGNDLFKLGVNYFQNPFEKTLETLPDIVRRNEYAIYVR